MVPSGTVTPSSEPRAARVPGPVRPAPGRPDDGGWPRGPRPRRGARRPPGPPGPPRRGSRGREDVVDEDDGAPGEPVGRAGDEGVVEVGRPGAVVQARLVRDPPGDPQGVERRGRSPGRPRSGVVPERGGGGEQLEQRGVPASAARRGRARDGHEQRPGRGGRHEDGQQQTGEQRRQVAPAPVLPGAQQRRHHAAVRRPGVHRRQPGRPRSGGDRPGRCTAACSRARQAGQSGEPRAGSSPQAAQRCGRTRSRTARARDGAAGTAPSSAAAAGPRGPRARACGRPVRAGGDGDDVAPSPTPYPGRHPGRREKVRLPRPFGAT